MLVVIGKVLGDLDAHKCAQLPRSLRAVYYLARLGRTLVDQLIGSGRIHPGLSLRAAKSLLDVTDLQPERQSQFLKLKARLAHLAVVMRAESGTWPEEQCRLLCTQLQALANEICGEKSANGTGARKVSTGSFNSWPGPQLTDAPSVIFTEAVSFPKTLEASRTSFAKL
jgi:hypothetical protein